MACGQGILMGSERQKEQRKLDKMLKKLPQYVEPWKNNVRDNRPRPLRR